MAYSDKVIDHYENPATSAAFGTQKDEGAHRRRRHRRRARVRRRHAAPDQGRRGQPARSRTPSSSASAAARRSRPVPRHRVAQGQDRRRGLEIKNTEIVEELSLPPVKIHCSVLAEDAIRSAIRTTRRRATPTEALARVSCPAEFASSDFASSDQPAGKRRMTEANDKTEAATVDSVVPRGIHLTEKAAGEVKRVIAEEKLPAETALRVGCKGGGCSGFSYVLGLRPDRRHGVRPQLRHAWGQSRDRQEERILHGRHDDRLQRREPPQPRLHVHQPQGERLLRLRHVLPGLSLRTSTSALRPSPTRASLPAIP
jgi:nitrogen fixation NifU-like protein